jgi:hypothetical protein
MCYVDSTQAPVKAEVPKRSISALADRPNALYVCILDR